MSRDDSTQFGIRSAALIAMKTAPPAADGAR